MEDKKANINCVEMKHKAAAIITKKISKMNRAEELKYWQGKIGIFSKTESKTKIMPENT